MMLGNFSVNDMETRLGVSFPEELVDYMNKNRQQDISIRLEPGKWHCFDIPFFLFCADRETAVSIHDFLKPLASAMKTQLEIGIQGDEQ